MPDKRLAGAIVMMVAGLGCGAASGQMLEDFEHGDAGRYSATGGGSIQMRADARYNGSLGARVTSPEGGAGPQGPPYPDCHPAPIVGAVWERWPKAARRNSGHAFISCGAARR